MHELFSQVGFGAIIDILITALFIYYLLIFLRGTRTMYIITGLLIIIGAVFLFSQLYPLNTLKWLMNKFYSSFIIIMVILFQDDIKRVLSRIGKRGILPGTESVSSKQMLDEITRAAAALVPKRIGALIVIERNIILNRYIDVGILLDSRVSMEVMVAIFQKESPIHDGAVIIQQGRIAAAGCFLPLTREENINPILGTRHRAAIGISQETDAIVVIISEERGAISIVVDGKVSRALEPKELRKALRNLIHDTHAKENEPKPAEKQTLFGNWAFLEKMRIFRLGNKK